MSPKQFLELLAASLPDPSTSTRSRLLALAPRIEADVPPQHLTREVVDADAAARPAPRRNPEGDPQLPHNPGEFA